MALSRRSTLPLLLAAALIMGTSAALGQSAEPAHGFKGLLQRTANALTGQPTAPPSPLTPGRPNTFNAGGTIPGTLPQGQAVTDGPVYRPQGSRRQFKGIFDGYSIATAVPKGTYPRVALTFETYGAAEACWTIRARIWASAHDQHDERFELCDAPMSGTDDLGNAVTYQDPTMNLMSVIEARRYVSKSTYTVTTERTEGPNPPANPFDISVTSAQPVFRTQYEAILARAMVISGYVSQRDASVGNMRMGAMAGSAGQLLWVAGFAPGGNKDRLAP